MLLTNLALFAAIGLAVAASAAYVVHKVRSVNREARLREQRRAAALLAQVSLSTSPEMPLLPLQPGRAPQAGPGRASPDRLDDALSSFFTPAAAPATPGTVPSALTTSARALADRLREAADRIDEVAAGPSGTTAERSETIVSLAAEATSPAALRPVIVAALPAVGSVDDVAG